MSLYSSASCATKPVEWFFAFPKSRDEHERDLHRLGLATCASCPVREQCRVDHADEPEGLWGGEWRQPSRVYTPRLPEVRCGHCGDVFTRVNNGSLPRCDRCVEGDPGSRKTVAKRALRKRDRLAAMHECAESQCDDCRFVSRTECRNSPVGCSTISGSSGGRDCANSPAPVTDPPSDRGSMMAKVSHGGEREPVL